MVVLLKTFIRKDICSYKVEELHHQTHTLYFTLLPDERQILAKLAQTVKTPEVTPIFCK